MSVGKKHGTDCFEVESFLQKNGTSKMYQVRHKGNGKLYTMEVSPREPNSKAPVSPYVQQTMKVLSEFWVNLRFTFQTQSKFYYILDHAGNETLSHLVKLNGVFPESTARFYISEVVVCLEEFHDSRLVYRELDLDSVYVDSKGHVVIWRRFCDKLYWSKRECVCSLAGFRHGDPCNNNHDLRTEFKNDWISLGNLLLAMLTGQSHQQTHFSMHHSTTQQTISLSHILSASASDLIRRLVRGDIYRSEQIQSHPFFRGIDWHEVRKRNSRAPGFHLNLGSEQEPSSSRSSPRHASINKEQFTISVPSSPYWRPHSSSFYSDPGRPTNAKHTHGHVMHHPGLHSAVSTPDLSSWGRDPPVLPQYSSFPVGRMHSHHEVPGYSNFAKRDFQVANGREQERRPLVSRSLSDLSSFCGSDAVFLPSSSTSFQRTFMEANFHGGTLYGGAKDLGNWSSSLVRSGSQGDLSASYGPQGPPYYSTYSGRSSPTPSQYSDYSSYSSYSSLTSPRGLFDSSPRSQVIDNDYSSKENDNVFASGYQVVNRRGPREFEGQWQISGSPNHSAGGRFSFYSGDTRPNDSSSSHHEVSADRSSTNYSTNLVTEEREVTTRNDGKRTSNEVGRERTLSLSRTLSCSDIGDEKRQSESRESTSDLRRESLPFAVSGLREKYPLAQVPIPSFREFRNRKGPSDSADNSVVEKDKIQKEAKDRASNTGGRINRPLQTGISTFRNEEETDSKSQNRLSSLYESAKDISGHSKAKRLRESSKSLNLPDKLDTETFEKSRTTSTDGKESPRKYSKNRQESPFSKNEVIHQLMLKYGLYEKNNHRKANSPSNDAPEEQERNGAVKVAKGDSKSPQSRKRLSHRRDNEGESETFSPGSNRRTANKSSPRSLRKNADTSRKEVEPKSKSVALKEMARKDNLTVDSSEEANSPSFLTKSTFNRPTVEPEPFEGNGVETDQQEKDTSNASNNNLGTKHRRNDLDSTMVDTLKTRVAVMKSGSGTEEVPADKGDDSVDNNSQFSEEKPKRPRSMYNTSRTILYATKFKKAVKNKAEKVFAGSPLPDRKSVKEIIISSDVSDDITNREPENTNERKDKADENNDDAKSRASVDELSPDYRRWQFRQDNGLRKRGIHTSMLSVASSFYSSDNDIDDAISIQSEADSLDGERTTRGRRWDSFYSTVSADSGSAHMFEYETDSAAAEFEEVFDDQDSEDEQPRGEVDVERADSGVGGDMGQSPMRRSWEEIMMKSSEHWSVVAASARHWQELARRKRAGSSTTSPSRKKQSINENMVECPDCLKHYLPPKEKETSNNPQICSKCKDRRIERKEAIIELVQTEINYGNDLQILKEEFYIPMQSGGILSPENLAAIFLNLQELLEVNSKFCAKLQKSLEDSVAKGDEEFAEVNVGSIFLESVDFFQAYEIYCSKQNAASSLLYSLQKKTELLRIFLNVTCRENPKCRKMDLNSFILAPVQRIMKYPLLLSRICKASPRRNPDREKLKVAQRRIEEQLNKINALNTAIESRQKRYRASQQLGRSDSLDKVQMKKMASDILNWTMEEMQLLMHGVFQVNIHEFNTGWNRRGSKKALSVCVLFCVRGHSEHVRIDSDDEGECEEQLFPGEGEVTDAALLLLRKKINGKYTLFREPLYLDMCVIYRDCERKDSFEIVILGKESYVFRAQSTKECRRWLKYLRIESKDLGTWKRRRNGLPNIMIKNL